MMYWVALNSVICTSAAKSIHAFVVQARGRLDKAITAVVEVLQPCISLGPRNAGNGVSESAEPRPFDTPDSVNSVESAGPLHIQRLGLAHLVGEQEPWSGTGLRENRDYRKMARLEQRK